MKKLIQFAMFGVITITSLSAAAQNITVTPNSDANQLITNHLLGGGIFASNIQGTLSPSASGTFTASGNTSFTLTGGIILSSGVVTGNPNVPSFFASTGHNAPGSPLLNSIVAPYVTFDAQTITFDFKAASDSVEFDFVFGSEEYNEYVNTNFNDVFAFFVSGPGYAPNTNVAILPGTTTPISINNVNNGNAFGVSQGPCNNCNYFIDNNVQPAPIDFAFDGMTTTIKIKFPVNPCDDYTFTIAIADVADGVFDSGVMLGANTFIACPNVQINNRMMSASPDTITMCSGGSVTLTAPTGAGLSWSTGETTPSITVTQPGTYSCMYTSGSCFAFTDPVVVIQSGSIQTPVIIQNGILLESNITPAPSITYQWSFNGADIPGANGAVYTPTANGCYTLTIFEGSCESSSNTVCVTNTSVAEWLSSQVQLIPNPSRDVMKIVTPFQPGSETTIMVMDLSGRMVFEKRYSSTEFLLEVNTLNSGMYLLQLVNSSTTELVRKMFVVE